MGTGKKVSKMIAGVACKNTDHKINSNYVKIP